MPGSEVNLCYFHNIFEVRVSFLFCFCSLVTDDGDMQSLVKTPDSHVKLFYFHVLKFLFNSQYERIQYKGEIVFFLS